MPNITTNHAITYTNSTKTWKRCPNFLKFLTIFNLVIGGKGWQKKQFQRLNIVLNNKTGLLFLEFNGCEDTFQPLKKDESK